MHEKNFLEKRSKQDLIKLCEYKSYNITQLINKLDNHISNIKDSKNTNIISHIIEFLDYVEGEYATDCLMKDQHDIVLPILPTDSTEPELNTNVALYDGDGLVIYKNKENQYIAVNLTTMKSTKLHKVSTKILNNLKGE